MKAELLTLAPHQHSLAAPRLPSTREPAVECPGCQTGIPLTRGMCGHRQIDAVLLQSARLGSELECQQCGQRFIFHRADPLTSTRPQAPRSAFSSI